MERRSFLRLLVLGPLALTSSWPSLEFSTGRPEFRYSTEWINAVLSQYRDLMVDQFFRSNELWEHFTRKGRVQIDGGAAIRFPVAYER